MTRLWIGCNPSNMCDQHLKGEHKEAHQLVGTIKAAQGKRSMKPAHAKASLEGLVGGGFIPSTAAAIRERHEQVRDAIRQRGLFKSEPKPLPDFSWQGPDHDVLDAERNRDDLAQRCAACRENGVRALYEVTA